ncbi:MAG: GtrA family protein [Bradymonadaceae bacterium]
MGRSSRRHGDRGRRGRSYEPGGDRRRTIRIAESGPIAALIERIGRDEVARFAKFGVVGVLGIAVNWAFFEVGYWLFGFLPADYAALVAYVVGLVTSIFANFVLNDVWTWGDRAKGGLRDWFARLLKYYVTASIAGVVQVGVSWASLRLVWSRLALRVPAVDLNVAGWNLAVPAFEAGPRLGLLTGVAFGMFINFFAGHFWAFKDAEQGS